jgi:hypothetical protein
MLYSKDRKFRTKLVSKEHLKAETKDGWDEESYKKSRMVDKIDLLQEYLPDFLVKNKDLYKILSLGVHGLSEKECLKYFDALKMGIEEILDEKVIASQKKKKRKSVEKSLQNIRNDIQTNKKK